MSKSVQKHQVDLKKIDTLIEECKEKKWALIPLLQKIQEEVGYIPPEATRRIANNLGLYPVQVQGVISFYSQLYTTLSGSGSGCYFFLFPALYQTSGQKRGQSLSWYCLPRTWREDYSKTGEAESRT